MCNIGNESTRNSEKVLVRLGDVAVDVKVAGGLWEREGGPVKGFVHFQLAPEPRRGREPEGLVQPGKTLSGRKDAA